MATARAGTEIVDGRKRVRVWVTVGERTLALDVAEAAQLEADLARAVPRARTLLAGVDLARREAAKGEAGVVERAG